VTDALTNYESVKFTASEDYEQREYGSKISELMLQQGKVHDSNHLNNCIKFFVVIVMVAVSLLLCAQDVADKTMTLTEFVAIQVLLMDATAHIGFLGWLYAVLKHCFADVRSLVQLFKEDDFILDCEHAHELVASTQDCSG
jgi:ABC-type transport system involved in Fe-S cluster assembly fused permease/ATPase subunit